MKDTNHAVVAEIGEEVLGYLEEHSNAADSIEGIERWWLMQRLARYSRDRIKQALIELEARQEIQRRVLDDGREVYGATKEDHS